MVKAELLTYMRDTLLCIIKIEINDATRTRHIAKTIPLGRDEKYI